LSAAERAYSLAPHNAFSSWHLALQMLSHHRFAEALRLLDEAGSLGLSMTLVRPFRIRALLGRQDIRGAESQLGAMLCDSAIDDVLVDLTIPLMADQYWAIDSAFGRAALSLLVQSYRDHARLGVLASALAKAAEWVVGPQSTAEHGAKWVALWRELAQGDEEFGLALRLLEALIAYRETEDPRVLLGLPVEERRIAEEVLGRIREPPLDHPPLTASASSKTAPRTTKRLTRKPRGH
jgi:hypothetical protein